MSILRIDVSASEWERLRKLLEIKHEHGEAMNECSICDKPLVTCAIEEITEHRTLLQEARKLIPVPRLAATSPGWMRRNHLRALNISSRIDAVLNRRKA